MAIKTCTSRQSVYSTALHTYVIADCNAGAIGCIYEDGEGWRPICSMHLVQLLANLGPVVIRSM